MQCDILVIGGGPGGYVAAIRAAQLGAKTVLVEKDDLGGTCLNRGCIPTKALLHSSELANSLKHAEEFGIKKVQFELDYEAMYKRKNNVVQRLRNGVKLLLQKNKVEVIKGTASFKSQHDITIENNGQIIELKADKTIIATGSVPVKLKIHGASNSLLTSDEALELQTIPTKVLVVGGGAIGIEFASIFSNLGSKVTIVEMMPTLLPGMDEEISKLLEKELKGRGIDVLVDAKLTEVLESNTETKAIIEMPNEKKEIMVEKILIAAGRAPYFEGLNMDHIGINHDKLGIKVDENMKTNLSNIYAIGDVVGGILLAHLASAQGIVAVEKAMGIESHQNLDIVPYCIYTEPEIAGVGLTENEAKKLGKKYRVSRFPIQASGKAVAIGAPEGLVKIISGENYGEILGVHIMASRATDLIAEACLALRMEATVDEIATTIHAHPTIAEALMETAHIAKGIPIHSI